MVAADERGGDIGKSLLDRAVALTEERDCEAIKLSSGQKRVDAHRFCEREGFANTHFKLTMAIGPKK